MAPRWSAMIAALVDVGAARARRRNARSRSTATRWLTATSSSSSEEATSSASPSRVRRRISATISACAPTSMPRVGSSRISMRGPDDQRARQHRLLLIAAGELADRLLRVGRGDRQARAIISSASRCCSRARKRCAASRAWLCKRDDDVLADDEFREYALGLAVLGTERDAAGDRAARGEASTLSRRRSATAPGIGAQRAEQQLGALGAAGAEQAREARRPRRRCSVRSNGAMTRRLPRPSATRIGSPVRVVARCESRSLHRFELAPEHQRHELAAAGFRRRAHADAAGRCAAPSTDRRSRRPDRGNAR